MSIWIEHTDPMTKKLSKDIKVLYRGEDITKSVDGIQIIAEQVDGMYERFQKAMRGKPE